MSYRGLSVVIRSWGPLTFNMASAQPTPVESALRFIRLHHGTDQGSAQNLVRHGVDPRQAAVWNGSGEFWASTDHRRAVWFALSHPNSPPAACFKFEQPESLVVSIMQISPPGALLHLPDDYEFLPVSHPLLSQHMASKQLVSVP